MGGGIGMGNTCKPMADSFQCMTKPTTIKKKKKERKEKMKRKRALNARLRKKDQGAAPSLVPRKLPNWWPPWQGLERNPTT